MKNPFLHFWTRIKHKITKKHTAFKKGELSIWTIIRYSLVGIISAGIFIILLTLAIILPSLPNIDNIEDLIAAQSSVILDRDGEILYTIHGDENRTIVPFNKISQYAGKAAMAIEDDQFYNHIGIDIAAILKAVCSELHVCSQSRGGSTITQQFVKNAFLSSERTYTRKLKEIILSLQLESKYTKDEIMELYLNRIPYGSSIYGVEIAAKTFFGKSAAELTIAESAILAAIPKAPTYYSPYGNNQYAKINLDSTEILSLNIRSEQELVDTNPDFVSKGLLGKTYAFSEGEEGETIEIYVKGRVDFVLNRMAALGYISEEEEVAALTETNTIEFQ